MTPFLFQTNQFHRPILEKQTRIHKQSGLKKLKYLLGSWEDVSNRERKKKKMSVQAQMILKNRGMMFSEWTITGHESDTLVLYLRW